jgi:ribonuclease Z
MRPSFNPRLVNDPADDPGLFIPFTSQNRAILFDLGDISALSSRDILKISHVFVSHTHMDHFVGFERLLRLLIGRNKTIFLYGPQGFIENIEGKLAGYTWNLVENYEESLVLEVTEVNSTQLRIGRYRCQDAFRRCGPYETRRFEKTLLEEAALNVSAVILDHGIPCLGLCLEERFHVNIRKDSLLELGLRPGPWLQHFKQAIFEGLPPHTPIDADCERGSETIRFTLETLARQITLITPGQKISYIVDIGFSDANADKAVQLAEESDHLFIETAFLDEHADIARGKNHLTAHQAGTIAARAKVKQMTAFHFSPRYTGQMHLLPAEARSAFETAR